MSNADSRVRRLEDQFKVDHVRVPFSWESQIYQLMCREYRQSLGLVNMVNFESKYQTISERKYWEELYRVRGYGPYVEKYHIGGVDVVIEVIPDPPLEFMESWTKKNGLELMRNGIYLEIEYPQQESQL